MRFNKKVFALALAGTMVCTSIVVPASSDSKNALKLKSANLLLESRGATRGQAVMMVLGALGYKEEANQDPNYIAMNPFTDVSDEYKGYLGLASDLGLVEAGESKTFESDKPIRRRQFLAMLLKVLNYRDAFTDTDNLAVAADLRMIQPTSVRLFQGMTW